MRLCLCTCRLRRFDWRRNRHRRYKPVSVRVQVLVVEQVVELAQPYSCKLPKHKFGLYCNRRHRYRRVLEPEPEEGQEAESVQFCSCTYR